MMQSVLPYFILLFESCSLMSIFEIKLLSNKGNTMEASNIEQLLEKRKKQFFTSKSEIRTIDLYLTKFKEVDEIGRKDLELLASDWLDTKKSSIDVKDILFVLFIIIPIFSCAFLLLHWLDTTNLESEEYHNQLKIERNNIIEKFNHGDYIYCENNNYRFRIENKVWKLEDDKFVKESGEYFYIHECFKPNLMNVQ